MTGLARTVLGDVPVSELGTTLIHEHLYMDCSGLAAAHGYIPDPDPGEFTILAAAECRWNPGAHPDNYRFTEHEPVLEDLIDYRTLGGGTVVDATPVDLGRNPHALTQLARESKLHVIMGTGFYLEATHRPLLREGDEESATYELIVAEHTSSGIRPGIIGEIGTSDPPTESELRVVRGAARAARETGLPLSIHLHPWGNTATTVLDVVSDTGLQFSRVLLNHLSTAIREEDRVQALLGTGVRLSFDLCGFDHSLLGPGRYPPGDDEAAALVARLLSDGFAGQVMMSHDIGVRTRLRRYGGWGYGHLLRHVVPLLRNHGIGDDGIRELFVTAPAEFLTLEKEL